MPLELIIFEPDDRAAASPELFERYTAQGADGTPAQTLEIIDLARGRFESRRASNIAT